MLKRLFALTSQLFTLFLAFVVAVIIWAVAVQSSDPFTSKSLELPVQTRGILAAEGSATVSVRTMRIVMQGPTSILTPLSNNDFQAYVDLSQVAWGTTDVPITLENPHPAVQILLREPETTAVTAEQFITREIPVRVTVRGQAARGHHVGQLIADPDTIFISGPAVRVNNLLDAEVTIFLEDAREDVILVRRPLFRDRNGNVVGTSTFDLSTEEVIVTIPINEIEGVAELPVLADWRGEPATGYRLLQVSVEPQSVLVTGAPTSLEELGFIRTETVDITGLNQSFQQRISLRLPNGVAQEDVQAIMVTFEIEPIFSASVIRKPPDLRALGPNLEVSLEPEQVSVFLYGPLPALETLQPDDISIILDLFDLGVGTHIVEPIVNILINDVEIRSVQPESITITLARPAPTPEPGEEDEE